MSKKDKTKELINYLEDTFTDLYEALDDLGFMEKDIDFYELQRNISQCDGCDWWFQSGELMRSPKDGQLFCDQCVEEEYE